MTTAVQTSGIYSANDTMAALQIKRRISVVGPIAVASCRMTRFARGKSIVVLRCSGYNSNGGEVVTR